MANIIHQILGIDKAIQRGVAQQLEQRSIALGDTPGMLRLLGLDSSAVNVTEDTALGISALFAAVTIRCNMMGTLPRRLYRRKSDRVGEEHTHPVAVLLEHLPENIYTPYEFWWKMEFNALMRGAAGAEIIRDESGRPVNLRMFRYGATWYQPFHADRPLIYDNETMQGYELSNVVYLPGLIVSDGLKNYTLLGLFRQTYGEELSAKLMRKNFYEMGPFLGGVYTYTGKLTDLQQNTIKTEFANKFGGVENAGAIYPLSQAEKFEQLQPPNFQQGQMVDLVRLRVEDSSRITGVPISLLQSVDSSSYNTMSMLFTQWKITQLDPRLTQLDQELNRKLLKIADLGTLYIETEIDELMWATPQERATYWDGLMGNGALTPNEIRRYLNKPPVEGGDQAYIKANNLQPLADVAKGLAQKNPTDATATTD